LVDINDTLIKLKARILNSKENLELIAFLERAINNINVSIPEGISDFSVDELQHLYDLLQGTVNSLNNSLQIKEQIKETEVKTDISSINELIKSSKIEQIQFKFNSSIIPDEFKELISGIAIIMSTDKKLKIQLDGHTDNIGRKEYNLYLSRLRAESVRNFLISKGIDSARISLSYYGMDKPMADNTTEQGRYLNRRVEMKLMY
jgi:outer membrane protein OmpA-like peptidoglycan-associated protein